MDDSAAPPLAHVDVPAMDDGAVHRLDAAWIRYRRTRALLAAGGLGAVLLIGAAVAAWLSGLPFAPLAAAALGAAVAWAAVGAWWPAVAYRHASYRVGTRALEIRRGVLWRRVEDVPRTRVQHSDVSQGPLERLYRLGTLTVYTAGTRYARVRLAGLAHGRALEIRDHLMQADGSGDVV